MTKNNYRSKKNARRIRYAKSGITGAQGIQGAEGSKGVKSGIKGSKAGEWHNGFWYQYDEETGRKVHWVPTGGGKAVPRYLDEVLEEERKAQEQGVTAADYGVDQEKWNKANEAIRRLEQKGVDILKISENPATHTYSIQWTDGKGRAGNTGLSIDGVLQYIHGLDKMFSTRETDAAEKSEKPETQTRPRVDVSQENDKSESNQDEKEHEPIKLTSRGDWTPRKDAPSADDVALCRRVANNLNHGWADALRKIASVQDDKKRRALFERAVNNAFDIYRRAFVCHGDGDALAEMIGREVEASEQGARKVLDNYLTLYDIGPREMLKYAPGLENLYNAHKDDDFFEGLENYNEPGDGKDEEETKDVDAGDEETRESEPTNETPEDAARSFIQDESNVPDETQTEPQSADDRQITIDGITDSIKAFKKKAASLRGRAGDLNRLVESKEKYKEDAALQKQFAEKLIKQADDLEKKIDDAVAQLSTEETEREEADSQGINESAEGETSPGEDAARAISRSVAQNDEGDDLQDELDGAREDVEPNLPGPSNETNETLNEEIENESSETTEPQAGTEELEEESASGEEPRAELESGANNEEIADETANGDGRTEADLEGEQEAEDVADDGMTPEQAAQAIGKIADEEQTLSEDEKQDEENAQTSKPSITNSHEPKPGIITGRPNTEDIDESQVYRVNISDLNLDPSRFQFKLDVDRQTGASSEYEGAKFNPKLAGKIMVWRDPADGKDYVVNGHHRYDMALKSGYTGDVDVKYITAPTPDDAKVQGAIENIADGKGTSTDCAEIMKSRSKEEIEKLLRDSGVSPRNAIMREGLLLANLDPTIFRDVKLGKISASLAAVLGKLLPNDHDRQRALYQKFIEPRLDAQGTNGKNKPLTADDVAAYALAYVGAQGIKPEGNFLFDAGLDYDAEVDARYELIKRVQKTLRNQKTTNSKMSKQGNVDVLTAGGALTGSIDIDTAKRNQKTAADALTRFTHDVQFKGELNDKFTEIVREYLNAKTADEREQIADRAVESVVNFYNGGERGLIGGPTGTHQDNAVGDAGSNREEGSGERDRELVSSDAQRRISDNAGREDRSSSDGTSVGAAQSAGDVGGRRRPGDDLQSDGNQSQSGRDVSEPSGDTGGVDAGTEQTGTEREGRVEPTVDESTEQETNAPQDEGEQEAIDVEQDASTPEEAAMSVGQESDFMQNINSNDAAQKVGNTAENLNNNTIPEDANAGQAIDRIESVYNHARGGYSLSPNKTGNALETLRRIHGYLSAAREKERGSYDYKAALKKALSMLADTQPVKIDRNRVANVDSLREILRSESTFTPDNAVDFAKWINDFFFPNNGKDVAVELATNSSEFRKMLVDFANGYFGYPSGKVDQVLWGKNEISNGLSSEDERLINLKKQIDEAVENYRDSDEYKTKSQEKSPVFQEAIDEITKLYSGDLKAKVEGNLPRAKSDVSRPTGYDSSFWTGNGSIEGFLRLRWWEVKRKSEPLVNAEGAQLLYDSGLIDEAGNYTELARRLVALCAIDSYKRAKFTDKDKKIYSEEIDKACRAVVNAMFNGIPILKWIKDNCKPGEKITLGKLARRLASKKVGLSNQEAEDACDTLKHLAEDTFPYCLRGYGIYMPRDSRGRNTIVYNPPKEEPQETTLESDNFASEELETAPNTTESPQKDAVEQTSETEEVSSQTPPTSGEQSQKARLMQGVALPTSKSDTSRPTGYNKRFFDNDLRNFTGNVLDSEDAIDNGGAQFFHDAGLLDDQGNWTDLAKRLAKGLRARSYKEPGILETELEATNSIFENVPVLRWLKDNYKPGTTINLARLKRTLMSKRVGLSEEEAQDAVLTIARLTDCFFNRFRQADPMRSLNEGSMEVLLYPPAPKEEYESEIAKNEKLASETAPNVLNSRGMSVKEIYDSNAYNLRLRMQQYYPETSEETQNTDEADQEAIEVEPTNETPEEAAQAVGEIADETPGDEETAAQAVGNSAGAEENAPTTRVDVRTATSALNAIAYELNEKYNKARSQSAKSKLRAALAEVSAWTNRLNDPNRSGEYADILDAAKYSFSPSGDKNKVFQKLNSVRQFLDGYDSLFQSGEDADADENVEATTTPDTENIPETPEEAAQTVGEIADGVTDVADETPTTEETNVDTSTLRSSAELVMRYLQDKRRTTDSPTKQSAYWRGENKIKEFLDSLDKGVDLVEARNILREVLYPLPNMDKDPVFKPLLEGINKLLPQTDETQDLQEQTTSDYHKTSDDYERVLDNAWTGKHIAKETGLSTDELKQAASGSPEIQRLIAEYANAPLEVGTTAEELNQLTPRQRSIRQNKADRAIVERQKDIANQIKSLLDSASEAAQAVGAIADGVTDVAGETQNANESTDDLETLLQERKRVRDERDAVLKSGNASRINENTDHLNELTERIKEAENRLIAPLEDKLSELQSEEDPKKRVEGLEAFRREVENLRVESESKGYSPISEIYKYIADKIDKSRTDAKIDELNSRRSSSEPEAAAREVSEQAENAPTPATPEESAQEVGQAAESAEIPGDVAAQETAKIADEEPTAEKAGSIDLNRFDNILQNMTEDEADERKRQRIETLQSSNKVLSSNLERFEEERIAALESGDGDRINEATQRLNKILNSISENQRELDELQGTIAPAPQWTKPDVPEDWEPEILKNMTAEEKKRLQEHEKRRKAFEKSRPKEITTTTKDYLVDVFRKYLGSNKAIKWNILGEDDDTIEMYDRLGKIRDREKFEDAWDAMMEERSVAEDASDYYLDDELAELVRNLYQAGAEIYQIRNAIEDAYDDPKSGKATSYKHNRMYQWFKERLQNAVDTLEEDLEDDDYNLRDGDLTISLTDVDPETQEQRIYDQIANSGDYRNVIETIGNPKINQATRDYLMRFIRNRFDDNGELLDLADRAYEMAGKGEFFRGYEYQKDLDRAKERLEIAEKELDFVRNAQPDDHWSEEAKRDQIERDSKHIESLRQEVADLESKVAAHGLARQKKKELEKPDEDEAQETGQDETQPEPSSEPDETADANVQEPAQSETTSEPTESEAAEENKAQNQSEPQNNSDETRTIDDIRREISEFRPDAKKVARDHVLPNNRIADGILDPTKETPGREQEASEQIYELSQSNEEVARAVADWIEAYKQEKLARKKRMTGEIDENDWLSFSQKTNEARTKLSDLVYPFLKDKFAFNRPPQIDRKKSMTTNTFKQWLANEKSKGKLDASESEPTDAAEQEAVDVPPTSETPEEAAMSVGNSVDAEQRETEPERESVETLENRVRAYLNGDPKNKAYMGSNGHKPTPRHEHEDLAVLKSASPDSFDYRFAFNRLQATIRNTPPSWRKKDRDEWKDYHAERQIIPFRPDDAESLLSKNMRDFDVNGSRYTTVEEFIKRGLLSKAVPDEMKPIPYDVIFATLLNSNECKEALADMCTALSRKAAYFTPYGNDDDSRNAWYRLRTSLVNACLSNQTDAEPDSMSPEEEETPERDVMNGGRGGKALNLNTRITIDGYTRPVKDFAAMLQRLRRQSRLFEEEAKEQGEQDNPDSLYNQEAKRSKEKADHLLEEIQKWIDKENASVDLSKPIKDSWDDSVDQLDVLSDDAREVIKNTHESLQSTRSWTAHASSKLEQADNIIDEINDAKDEIEKKRALYSLARFLHENAPYSSNDKKSNDVVREIRELAKFNGEDISQLAHSGDLFEEAYFNYLARDLNVDQNSLKTAVEGEPSLFPLIADYFNTAYNRSFEGAGDGYNDRDAWKRAKTRDKSANTRTINKILKQIKQIINGDDASEFNWDNIDSEPTSMTPEESAARAISASVDEPEVNEETEENEATQEREPGAALRGLSKAWREKQETTNEAEQTETPSLTESLESEPESETFPDVNVPETVDEDETEENERYANRGEDGYYSIDEDAAKRAQEANSFREYKPNSITNDYRALVDDARKVAEEQKKKVDPMYHERIDSILNRYERELANWYNKWSRNQASYPSWMITGRSNYDWKKNKRKSERTIALSGELEKIQDLLSDVKSVGTGGISSDDSNAVVKIENKIARLKDLQEKMKEANKYWRKNQTWEGYDGPLQISDYDRRRNMPFTFELSNNNAEIRRNEKRLQQLKATQGANFGDDVPFDGGVVHFNKEANRIQLKFDDKPDAETISKLKSNGFKWAPREKAWQRMLNGNGIYAAKSLGYLPEDYKAKKGEEPAPTAPEPTESEPDDQTPEDAARAVSAMADETTSQEVETPPTAPEPETASTAPEPVAEETATAPAPIEKETASPEIDEKPNVTYEEVKDLFTGENGVDRALSFRGTEYRAHVFSPLFHTGILDKQGLGMAGAFIDDLAPKVRLDGKYKGGAKINADELREHVIKPFARLLGIEPREGELGPSLLARMKENLESRKSRLLSGNENFNAFMNAKKERESLVAEELKKTIKEIPGADTLGEDKINEIVRDHVNSGFTEIDRGYVEDAIKEKKRISGLYEDWQKEMDAGNFQSFGDIQREDNYFFHDCNHDTACFIGSAYDQYGGRNRRDNLYEANMSRNSELLSNSTSAKKAYALAHAHGQSSLKPGFYSHRALDELVRANQRRLNFKEDAPGKWTFKGGSLSYVFDPETSTTHFELQLSQAPCQASLNKLKEGYDKRFRYKDGVWRSPDIQPADKEADERYYAERFQKLGLLPIDFDFTDHCQNGELAQSKPKEENAEFETVDDSNSGIASSFISKDGKNGNGLDKYDGAYVIAGGKDIDNYNAVWRDFETPADGEEFRENNSIDSENLLGFIGMPFFRRESLEGSIERDIAVHEAKERLESFYQGARGARARKALAISYSDAANNCRGVAHMRVADELVAINQKLINFRETKPGVWKFGNMGQLEFRYFPYTGERQMTLSFGGKIRMGNSEGSFNTITTDSLRSMGWKYDKYDKTWTSPYIKNGLDLDRCIRMPLQSIGLLPYYFDYNGHCVNEPKATQDDRPTQYARMTSEDVARMISRAVDRYYAKSV